MKKIKTIGIIFVAIFSLSATIKSVNYHNFPPTNCAGSPNGYTCGFCHSTYSDNQPGGNVSINGIPTNFISGTVYPFSLKIQHFASNRKMFGYDIQALDAQGNNVGTFTTTNPTATINNGELTSHNPSVVADTSTQTVTGLFWKAPTTPLATSQLPISFYFCGNACDHNQQPTNDYVYNDSFHTNPAPLALNFISFTVDRINSKIANIKWQCNKQQEVEKFDIEFSENNLTFESIAQLSTNLSNVYNYSYSLKNQFKSCYFRIKFTNKNGLFGYSDVKTLRSNINFNSASVFPNPVHKNTATNLRFQTLNNTNCSLIVTNTLGVIVEQKIIQVQKGDNNIYYPVNPILKSGIYNISIIQDNKIIQQLEIVVND